MFGSQIKQTKNKIFVVYSHTNTYVTYISCIYWKENSHWFVFVMLMPLGVCIQCERKQKALRKHMFDFSNSNNKHIRVKYKSTTTPVLWHILIFVNKIHHHVYIYTYIDMTHIHFLWLTVFVTYTQKVQIQSRYCGYCTVTTHSIYDDFEFIVQLERVYACA